MRWILRVLGLVVVIIVIAASIGAALPKEHVATRTTLLRQPPETIWQVITDYGGSPSWRRELKTVERLPDHDGNPVWREIDQHGQGMSLETVEAVPPNRLVRRIADQDLPFGGTWTYELVPAEGGSRLTITENGEVYNPIFRFMSRFLFGHTASIDSYLKSLGKKFGEEVTITS
ncbi:MAG: SRPBCC family protein [Acidobacteria bacterium]|nr:SRPBCC family protein [Acidobacteriota bacterium]